MWKAAIFVNYALKDRRSKYRFLNILESAPQQAVARAEWCELGIISPKKQPRRKMDPPGFEPGAARMPSEHSTS